MYLCVKKVKPLNDYNLELTLEWPNKVDLDPEVLYEKSKVKKL